MRSGCFTALVTPFRSSGDIDSEGLERLIDFQINNGITGILAVGTTGESPSLSWEEHNAVIKKVAEKSGDHCLCVAGTGSNNTREALTATAHASDLGVDAVLLVDPYYNGPSSLEIRREYVAPIATEFPGLDIIPYVIPGRTGTQLLPEDLAILAEQFENVQTVKEATGSMDNMRRVRQCCGDDYRILSGDDGLTFDMMTDPSIAAGGVISVASNVAPAAVGQMVTMLREGDRAGAEALSKALTPLFSLLMIKTEELTPYGPVLFRARNPLPIKTLMALLGMPSGPCRPPMGRLTEKAMEKVLTAARTLWTQSPEILRPAAEFFDLDIPARLEDPASWRELTYKGY